mmetsp:Transcript_183876/g.583225  ORF Transcript_183876/g.583225 Transcript_183876/m.583225 type:complete len:177 (-) Transcript_183876:272-802(-)
MHPAWEEVCEEIAVIRVDSARSLSPGPSPGRSARSAESARSRRSVRSWLSTASVTTTSSSSSHLSNILPALGLGPLRQVGGAGHFSGAECNYDGNGGRFWPSASPSSEGADVKESPDEWCVDDDLGDGMGSTAPSSPASATLGKIRSGKMAGASEGKVWFSEPAAPARHAASVMSL